MKRKVKRGSEKETCLVAESSQTLEEQPELGNVSFHSPFPIRQCWVLMAPPSLNVTPLGGTNFRRHTLCPE